MDITFEIDKRLDHLQAFARAARDITLPLFANPEGVVNKASGSDYDPVTKADIDAEIQIRALIQAQFPGDSIEGEECPDHVGSNDFSWTLDPIDGTRAFVAGVPVWTTLIALSYKGQPVLGMIDVPALDKKYYGRIDGDVRKAWIVYGDHYGCEERKLKTKSCAGLQEAILGCALGYGLVAEGRMDIIIEALLKPCDVRALMPVIEGAGGKLTNWQGGSAVNGGRVVAVGDPSLLPELYTYLGKAIDT